MAFLSSNWGPIVLIIGLAILALGTWGSFKKDHQGQRGENGLIWFAVLSVGFIVAITGGMKFLMEVLT